MISWPARRQIALCYAELTVQPAVIQLTFDPYLRVAGQAVRWETLGIAAAVVPGARSDRPASPDAVRDGRRRAPARRDDLLFIVLGIVPGAVIGGRLTYVLAPPRLLPGEPGPGRSIPRAAAWPCSVRSSSGTLTGIYVARLLEAPIGRWLDLAAVRAAARTRAGQACPASSGRQRAGPRFGRRAGRRPTSARARGASLGPELPAAVPAQVYEAIGDRASSSSSSLSWPILGAVPLGATAGASCCALGGWAIVRFSVAFTVAGRGCPGRAARWSSSFDSGPC